MASAESRTRFEQLAVGRTLHIETGGVAPGARHLVRHPIDGKLMTQVAAGPFARVGAVGEAKWLPAFYIDVYPTTSGECARFVAATGHRPPAHWPDGKFEAALADSLVEVSWLDAEAYAIWAGSHRHGCAGGGCPEICVTEVGEVS
jgi:formylglycine-generating enzyme required for sulfatase activity